MVANCYLEVSDLVSQMTSVYKFDMSNIEIVDIIIRFGEQYLDIRDNYGRLVIKDKAPTTVPNLDNFCAQAPVVHQALRYKVICGIRGVRRPYRRSGCTGCG